MGQQQTAGVCSWPATAATGTEEEWQKDQGVSADFIQEFRKLDEYDEVENGFWHSEDRMACSVSCLWIDTALV